MNTHEKYELPPLPEAATIQRVWEGYPGHAILKDTKSYTEQQVREAQQAAIESYIKRTNQADGEHTIKIGDVTLVAYGPQGSGKTRILDQIQEMLTSTAQPVSESDMPSEFQSGNDIPVAQATIKRERMEEIIRDAISKATGDQS